LILGAGNKVEYRPVKLGAMFNGLRIIDQGLKSGEKIILKGLVGPGMQVNPNIVPMQDNTQQAKVANQGEK
jgi:gold/copper resistance efflux system membrane fusion protein